MVYIIDYIHHLLNESKSQNLLILKTEGIYFKDTNLHDPNLKLEGLL